MGAVPGMVASTRRAWRSTVAFAVASTIVIGSLVATHVPDRHNPARAEPPAVVWRMRRCGPQAHIGRLHHPALPMPETEGGRSR